MALLYIDGFDFQDSALRWVQGGAANEFTYATSTRFGAGKALTLSTLNATSSTYALKGFPASGSIYIGAALQVGSEGGGNDPTANLFGMYTDGGSSGHIYLRRLGTNAIALYRGNPGAGDVNNPNGTQIAVSVAGVLDSNWHYVEVYAVIHATTGRLTVRVDGATVIDFTGNTRNGGTSTNIDGVRFRTGRYTGGSTAISIDDLYICDTAGTVNNTFLGDVRVQSMTPNAAGSSTQLTPTGSANNYANAAEVPYNNTTYNSSSTVGQRDTYALSDLAISTTTILATQSVAHMQKSDAGTANAKVALKSGGGVYYDATQSLGTSPTVYVQLRETDPATSAAWTVGNANALEAGMEVA